MSIDRYAATLARLSALSFLLLDADASNAQSPQDRLAGAKSITCEFSLVATGTWTNGESQAAVKTAALPLKLQFEEINTQEGSAQTNETLGKFDIIVRLTAGTLHFIQMMQAGPLYVTTVFAKESRPGKLTAVHTRHEYLESFLPAYALRPQLYYGQCEVTP